MKSARMYPLASVRGLAAMTLILLHAATAAGSGAVETKVMVSRQLVPMVVMADSTEIKLAVEDNWLWTRSNRWSMAPNFGGGLGVRAELWGVQAGPLACIRLTDLPSLTGWALAGTLVGTLHYDSMTLQAAVSPFAEVRLTTPVYENVRLFIGARLGQTLLAESGSVTVVSVPVGIMAW